jgi:hypothetical protein
MRNKAWIILPILFLGIMIYGIVETAREGTGVFWLPIGIVGFTFSIIWGTIFRGMMRNRRVLKTGEPGTARVLKMSETGVTVNNNPMVKLEVEVTPQRGSSYITTTRVLVSRLNPMMYGPGRVVAVKIDPKDPMVVVIDPNGNVGMGGGNSASSSGNNEITERRNAAMLALLTASDKVRAELLASGLDAEGTILSLWSLDVTVNDMAVGMEFLVEAEIPGRRPFPIEIKGVVAHTSMGKYAIGSRVKLKYDPVDPEHRVTINGVVGVD